jgi:hypothetical protein
MIARLDPNYTREGVWQKKNISTILTIISANPGKNMTSISVS